MKRTKRLLASFLVLCMCLTMMPFVPIQADAASNDEIRQKMIYVLYGGKGGRMSCDFDGYVNTSGRHEGIDFTASGGKGSAIYALAAGVVTRCTNSSSLSTLAIYDEVNNKTVLYLHGSYAAFSVGTRISQGQHIGVESNLGASAAHTHVEVRDGKQTHARKSVNDYTLENANPYPYWNTIFDGGSLPDCSCSTSYAGDYICTTSSMNLTIRSGHSSSYGAVGSIPSGAQVKVTKASGNGAGHWAHVEYNGVSGYASMEYLKKKDAGNDPQGVLDGWAGDNGAITLSGWAFDKDDPNREIEIHVYVNGGGFAFGTGVERPDVNQAYGIVGKHGYFIQIGAAPGNYNVEVYAINVGGGGNVLIGSQTITVTAPLQIHASTTSVNLKLGETETQTIQVWDSGAYKGNYKFRWKKSNDNVDCKWGEWSNSKLPLTITAKNKGTAVVTLCVFDADTEAVLHSVDVNINVDAKQYTVSYNANGGSGAPSSQNKIHGTDLTLSSTKPTRSGYNFIGWATSSGAASAAYQPGGKYTNNEAATLYAVWEKLPEYQLVYDANGGNGGPGTDTVKGNVVYAFSKVEPTRTGYDFGGWSKYKDGTGTIYTPGSQADTSFLAQLARNGGMTLYAVWTPESYTVKYDANGGKGAPGDQMKIHNEALTLNTVCPTYSGHVFTGWATDKHAVTANYQPGDKYVENRHVTLYAVWTPETYTVKYDANGGKGAPSDQTKVYSEALMLSGVRPTRDGYVFKGWAADKTAVAAEYQPGDKYVENRRVTLYAVWEKTQEYTVTYDANGGTGAPGSQTKPHGEALTLSSVKPTRDGYVFKGWAADKTAVAAEYQPGDKYGENRHMTLYAVWEKLPSAPPEIPGPNDAQLVVESKSAKPGDTIIVQIAAKNITGVKSMLIENFQYDKTALEMIGAEMKLQGAFMCDWDEELEMAVVTYLENSDVNETVMELTFLVKDTADGDYAVTCDSVIKTLLPSGQEDNITYFEVPGIITVTSCIRGDINGDDYVNSNDAIYLLRHTLLPNRFPMNQSGDVNGDGYVNSNDAIYLLRHTLLPSRFPLH